MTEFSFVDLAQDESLAALVAEQARIGVDTEFMREKTFFSQLCLVQVIAGNDIVCADPLGLTAAEPGEQEGVWQSLLKPQWVLHSGRQDIEVVYQTCGALPQALFDTQIAAALLGYQPQLGYAGLVAELFDVELDKSHTRADWSRRPLSNDVLNYAAEDVLYLLDACDLLSERLEKLGRLEWATEDSSFLLDESLYIPDPELAIDRLKGARNLTGVSRAASVKLAAWREREAVRTNRPRQWIVRDPVILELAQTRPGSRKELENIGDLAASTIRRAGDDLLEIIATAGQDNLYQPPGRPDEQQKALLKKMQKKVSARADELGIAAEILAPRKELSAAMLGNRDSRLFRGWRQDIAGNEILQILESG